MHLMRRVVVVLFLFRTVCTRLAVVCRLQRVLSHGSEYVCIYIYFIADVGCSLLHTHYTYSV